MYLFSHSHSHSHSHLIFIMKYIKGLNLFLYVSYPLLSPSVKQSFMVFKVFQILLHNYYGCTYMVLIAIWGIFNDLNLGIFLHFQDCFLQLLHKINNQSKYKLHWSGTFSHNAENSLKPGLHSLESSMGMQMMKIADLLKHNLGL
jgi:hypothetical protein